MKAKKWAWRIVVLVVGVAVLLFFVLGAARGLTKNDAPPGIVDAPWAIQTSSRVYYGHEFSLQRGVPNLRGYWTLDGRHYTYHEGVISFPAYLYGHIDVIDRRKGG